MQQSLESASQSQANPLRDCVAALHLTLVLFARFWPQLMALWLIGFSGSLALTDLAALIGRWNALAGLSLLSLVVLLKLVIIVALFETVRRGLPALHAASAQNAAIEPNVPKQANFITALALTLVPFFAFYAAWGFLADTLRDYARLSLDLLLSGETAKLLEVTGGAWLIVSVAIAWAIRRFAKFMSKRSKSPLWPIVIVICEANWAFIGIFVISTWQDEIRNWFTHLPDMIGHLFAELDPVPGAIAQDLPAPAEFSAPSLSQRLQSVFFYALYPVVWLTLAALIYGYDINGEYPLPSRGLSAAVSKWQALPKFLQDFVSHFIAGTLKRYRTLAEGVGLALSSGFALTLCAILSYRLLDFGSAWAWFGISRWIGPQDIALWQVIVQGISLLFGTPSDPGEGLLVSPLKICLLAATLEIGFARGREWRARALDA
ncbi:hypothetical protein [Agrobacterium larrymoorei]|uniref:Uncharacterized protein n=1 Tax=Agrobacterium larrymoorei TaxID=160699 RepID=A0ABU0UFC1_9HYPH|nr:hypothetical protein [Agrobacterium larrymoorei]MDQ1183642.1 hypothetical protein [Agrobacterium larrymoorei]